MPCEIPAADRRNDSEVCQDKRSRRNPLRQRLRNTGSGAPEMPQRKSRARRLRRPSSSPHASIHDRFVALPFLVGVDQIKIAGSAVGPSGPAACTSKPRLPRPSAPRRARADARPLGRPQKLRRYSINCEIEIITMPCNAANLNKSGRRAIPPSSLTNSHRTPPGKRPAKRTRSHAASV